jgi:cell wall-associated NlpC family hydrolase
VAVGGLALVEISGGFPAVAEAKEPRPSINWAPIIECESGGNPRATNSSSTASGLVQFLDSSWKAYGGGQFSARAKDATPEQQMQIAEAAYQRSGLSPWAASRHCWGDDIDELKRGAPAKPVVDEAKPKSTTPRMAAGERDRDGRGTYVCDTARLHFDACDPETLGQVVEYPPYWGRESSTSAAPAPAPQAGSVSYTVRPGDTLVRIAARAGTSWQSIFESNRGTVTNPHRIYPGQRLILPTGNSAPAEETPEQPKSAPGSLASKVVSDARAWFGVPYRWGGNDRSGMDCSGLVQQVLLKNGIRSPRTADAQMLWAKPITKAQAQAGDLVFGVQNGRAHHIGIYLGDGTMIDSPDVGGKVGIHKLYRDSTHFGRIPV